MASYSYAGLMVRVTADTRAMARQIAADATRAGQQAGDSVAKEVSKGASRAGTEAGKAISSGVDKAAIRTGTSAGQKIATGVTGAGRRAAAAISSEMDSGLAQSGARIGARVGRALGTLIGQGARGSEVGSQIGQKIGAGISAGLGAVRAAASRVAGWLPEPFRAAASRAATAVSSGLSTAFGAVRNAASGAAQLAASAWSRITQAAAPITSALSRAFDAVQSAAGQAAASAGGVFSRIASAAAPVTSALSRAFSAVSSAATGAASSAASAFSRMAGAGSAIVSGLGRAFSAASSSAGRAAASAGSAFTRAAGSAGSAVTNGLGRAFAAVSSAGSRAAESVSQAFQRASATGAQILERTASGGGMLASLKQMPLAGKAAAAGVAVLGGSILKAGIEYNALEQRARAAFTTVMGSSQAANKMMDDLMGFARKSPFPRQAFIEATQQMISFGIESNKVIPYLGAIQDAVAATGGGAQQMSEITLVMSQIQAAGKITGVDLMQFAQRGINAADLIGKAMGKSGVQIKEEISNGTLDATAALDALAKGMDQQYGGAAANVKRTWSGTTDTIKGAMRDVGAAIVRPFIDPNGGGLAIEWGNKLATSMRAAIPAITLVAKGLGLALAGIATVLGWVFTAAGWVIGIFNRFSAVTYPIAGAILAMVLAFKLYQGALIAVTLAQQLATWVTGIWTAAINLAKFAWFALNYAMAVSPIGLIVLAVIGLVAAFAILWVKCAAFRNFWIGLWNAIRGAAVAAWNFLTGWISGAWDAVIGFIKNSPLLAALGLPGLVAWVVIHFDTVKGWITGAWNAVLAVTSAIWGAIVGAVTAAANAVAWAIAAAWNWISAVSAAIWNGIVWAITAAFNWLRAVVTAIVNALVWAVTAAWNWCRAVVTGIVNAFVLGITAAWNWARAVVTGIVNALVWALTAAWNWVRAVVTGIVQALVLAISAAWNWIRSVTQAIWSAIANAIAAAWNWIRGVVQGAVTWIGLRISAAWNWVRGITVSFWASIGQAIGAAWSWIKTAIWNATQWVIDRLAWVWGTIRNAAAAAWNGILGVIRSIWDQVKEVVRQPVAIVVKGVINPLIRGINVLLRLVKIDEIPVITGFAEGGKVPGGWGGGDRVPAMLEPGEWVLTKRQARGIGYSRLSSWPRYATGGMVGGPRQMVPDPLIGLNDLKTFGGAFARMTHISDLAKAGKDLFDDFSGLLSFAASEAFRVLTDPLKKSAEVYAKDPQGFPKQWIGKTVMAAIDAAVEFIAGKSMGACDAGGIVGHAMQFEGKPYRWGGGANPNSGFDCSSFVNFIAGSAGLPLPGGFKAPSQAHGPLTTDWLRFGTMRRVSQQGAQPGAVAVNEKHMGFIIGPGGAGFAARSTATGIGKQSFARGYTYLMWPGGQGAASGPCGPGGGAGPPGGFPVGVRNYAGLVAQVCRQLGIPWATNAFLSQMATESGGNPRAINNWDSNAKAGTPSKGLMQVIDPTFNAYAGPHRGRGIWDPLANIYAAVNYAKSRYGSRLLQAIGRGRGYARGGIISEPVVGFGLRSGVPYTFAENGPEYVSPLDRSPRAAENMTGAADAGTAGGITVNVYPRQGQDERSIAAAVSRELAWASAGGRR